MKSAFNLRSTLTKYHAIWYVNISLHYLQIMNTDSDMNKTMILLSGRRVSTSTHLKVTNMYVTDTECTFVLNEVLKDSRPKYCQNL